MARNQVDINIPFGEWTQLTNGDVSVMTFQVKLGSPPVYIRATTDTTTPTETTGQIYHETEGVLRETMTDIFALALADRVWARPVAEGRRATVFVDHV